MKQIITSILFLLLATNADAQSAFVRGADVSWCTEMEASGRKFYDANGQETELFALLKQIGMNAVRLRVWVNPEGYGYGAWCDKADVLKKAERAHQQGLDVMIDFHYSDFFADPERQEKPKDWSGYTTAQLKTAIADHTKEILTALKEKGIEPKWVQVGNETNNGMIFDSGKIEWKTKNGSARYTNYVALSNAAYEAVKEVLPDTYVIVHIANAFEAAESNGWFYREFKEAGGKFDMIGLSHYPDWKDWNSTKSDVASNANAANSVKKLGELFNVPVMITETGFPQQDVETGSLVMTDLFNKMKPLPQCAGILYWEPEVDGVWKPDYYDTVSWDAYAMGAFTTDGKPTAILAAFGDGSTGIHTVPAIQNDAPTQWYDLKGSQHSAPTKGLYIMKKGQETRKVLLP
jgi:arabinogalactan endo-1,4-beta-galactosidase